MFNHKAPVAVVAATPTPVVIVQPAIPTGTPEGTVTLPPLPSATVGSTGTSGHIPGDLTLTNLDQTQVNVNDPLVMAERLQGLSNIARTVPAPAVEPQVGNVQKFWVSNQDSNTFFQIDATLRYAGQHLYFWIENGVPYDPAAVKALVDAFDNQIYPTDRTFFGSEWTPGVDDDPHLYALYARHLGSVVAGYFSSQDEYPQQVFSNSNEHEMFELNADTTTLSDPYIYGVMAHEFQHMIHWNLDRNEDNWLNEGFSVLAQFINNYPVGGFDTSYISNPDTQLNDWSLDQTANAPHYGAAFLYLDYLLSRFGSDVTHAIVNSPLHGLDSIDAVLAGQGITDPLTGQVVTADSLFGDWAVANYLQDPQVGDGRYAYQNYPKAPKAHDTITRKTCPFSDLTGQVHQFGVDYIDITCQGQFTLNFSGDTTVALVPTQPYSGSYDLWSNRGDQSDMTLTHSFDFSGVSGSLVLKYHTWYDIEDGYDFVYLEASTDGNHWKVLNTPNCSLDNASGNNYGCGYTGSSGKWISQSVDLSAYAGKKVDLRFEYLTDAALNGTGFLLDDIGIDQINYFSNFEQDTGGWQADGFVRVDNTLPQTFQVSLILNGKVTHVEQISLNPDQSASIPLDLGGDVTNAVLVVSGTTRVTRQEASYSISVTP